MPLPVIIGKWNENENSNASERMMQAEHSKVALSIENHSNFVP